jgi:hypothetical protein
MQDGEYVAGRGLPRLHLTLGDDEPLRSKAVYFIRGTNKPLDVDKVSSLSYPAVQPQVGDDA